MNRKLIALLTGSLLAIAFIAGCGGDSGQPQNDEAAIRKVVSDFGKAFNDGKAGDVINLLDAESRKNCDEKQLAALMTLIKGLTGGQKFTAEATNIRVNGDRATAQVATAIGNEKQSPEERPFVKEGGKWKIAFGSEDCG